MDANVISFKNYSIRLFYEHCMVNYECRYQLSCHWYLHSCRYQWHDIHMSLLFHLRSFSGILVSRLLVGYPLTVIGSIFGKNWANGFDAPCRTKNIAREIPPLVWYRSTLAHCVVGGFLPFRWVHWLINFKTLFDLQISIPVLILSTCAYFKLCTLVTCTLDNLWLGFLCTV